jgi:type II secretory pathway component PulF
MLPNVADSYETQVGVWIGALTALMEPLIIVAMGWRWPSSPSAS